MTAHVHVIPVDPSLTPREAWEELLLMHVRATFTGEPAWAWVSCEGGCEDIADGQAPDPYTLRGAG